MISHSTNQITIYTTSYCPYCTYAKQLLTEKKLSFHEIDVTNNQPLRDTLIKITDGKKTVPQIFIGETSIGGYDNLKVLVHSGEFEKLLKMNGIKKNGTL